jgi:hypothetical protein
MPGAVQLTRLVRTVTPPARCGPHSCLYYPNLGNSIMILTSFESSENTNKMLCTRKSLTILLKPEAVERHQAAPVSYNNGDQSFTQSMTSLYQCTHHTISWIPQNSMSSLSI